MPEPMLPGAERALTSREWSALSPGLREALHAARVEPRVVARASAPARLASLLRGATPIMVMGRRIFWPRALDDVSGAWNGRGMAVLQHELQHVLEFATGELSVLRYITRPNNWRYEYRIGPGSRWRDFGAEQRASIVEHLWLIERGVMADPAGGAHHRRVIPWAG
ncbi:MAG TPA: hypothetical protein VMU59_00825 [Caulobacteraceae bacterium]|nr:hypothetical protein [Caulobacteraceae bacterium]